MIDDPNRIVDAWHRSWTPARIAELREAAARDDRTALCELGDVYSEGVRGPRGRLRVRPNRRLALRYWQRALELGDRRSMLGVANLLADDPRTRARGEQLYLRAFRLGDSTAAYNLAVGYKNRGRHRDAVRWFRRALAAGDESAGVEIARAELYGLGTRRNAEAAFARLRRVARRPTRSWPSNIDRMEAMLIMADALIDGWLVPINYRAGTRWLERAAKLGSTVASARLAGW